MISRDPTGPPILFSEPLRFLPLTTIGALLSIVLYPASDNAVLDVSTLPAVLSDVAGLLDAAGVSYWLLPGVGLLPARWAWGTGRPSP